MKDKVRYFNLIMVTAILLISGCASQDVSDQSNALPGFPDSWQSR